MPGVVAHIRSTRFCAVQSTGYTAGPGAGTSTVTSATQTAKPSGSAGASYNGVAAQKGSGIGGNTYADQVTLPA